MLRELTECFLFDLCGRESEDKHNESDLLTFIRWALENKKEA